MSSKCCFALAIIVAIASGCSSPESEWERIRQASSSANEKISSYQSFVERYPESPYSSEALSRIESLQWSIAYNNPTIAALSEFIETHPNSVRVDEASTMLGELEWQSILSNPTRVSLQAFIENNPGSSKVDEARKVLEELDAQVEYETIAVQSDPETFRGFLERHPDGEYGRLARERLLDLLPEPRIEFVLDQSVLGNWPEDLLVGFRQVVTSEAKLASLGTPVESRNVYVHYANGFGTGFDGNGRSYNWFSHELRIEVREDSGESIYEKVYEGDVPGAYRGRTFSTGSSGGIARGPVNYRLVLGYVEDWFRDDPL